MRCAPQRNYKQMQEDQYFILSTHNESLSRLIGMYLGSISAPVRDSTFTRKPGVYAEYTLSKMTKTKKGCNITVCVGIQGDTDGEYENELTLKRHISFYKNRLYSIIAFHIGFDGHPDSNLLRSILNTINDMVCVDENIDKKRKEYENNTEI